MAVSQDDLNQIIQAVWTYFKEHGIALDKNLIIAPDDEAGWAQIKIVALQDDGTTQVAGILNLEAVLEAYGGDIEAAKSEVIQQIAETAQTQLAALDSKAEQLTDGLEATGQGIENELTAIKTSVEGTAANVATTKGQIETLVSQAEDITQQKHVLPVTLDSEIKGLSITRKASRVYISLNDIEEETT